MIIKFTSHNDGSIDDGNCNYPLRGGANTFCDDDSYIMEGNHVSFHLKI